MGDPRDSEVWATPNGRSGGFVINLSDLKQIIAAASPDELVGRVDDKTVSRLLSVTACSVPP